MERKIYTHIIHILEGEVLIDHFSNVGDREKHAFVLICAMPLILFISVSISSTLFNPMHLNSTFESDMIIKQIITNDP